MRQVMWQSCDQWPHLHSVTFHTGRVWFLLTEISTRSVIGKHGSSTGVNIIWQMSGFSRDLHKDIDTQILQILPLMSTLNDPQLSLTLSPNALLFWLGTSATTSPHIHHSPMHLPFFLSHCPTLSPFLSLLLPSLSLPSHQRWPPDSVVTGSNHPHTYTHSQLAHFSHLHNRITQYTLSCEGRNLREREAILVLENWPFGVGIDLRSMSTAWQVSLWPHPFLLEHWPTSTWVS